MPLCQISIKFPVPLLLLLFLLPKNTAATSSSLDLPSPSSCEAGDDNGGGKPNWEQIEAKVELAVAGVTREVGSPKISNYLHRWSLNARKMC